MGRAAFVVMEEKARRALLDSDDKDAFDDGFFETDKFQQVCLILNKCDSYIYYAIFLYFNNSNI